MPDTKPAAAQVVFVHRESGGERARRLARRGVRAGLEVAIATAFLAIDVLQEFIHVESELLRLVDKNRARSGGASPHPLTFVKRFRHLPEFVLVGCGFGGARRDAGKVLGRVVVKP